ncbi:hypothetical protein EIP86_003168 [Pleurotus ostreatoroseus]|nr:hypothetical protein EIP86_003168 [Pleurotus ostreatoroseus]
MTAGQDQSPSRASDSAHSNRGRDTARRSGGRDDERRESARRSSRHEPSTGSASSTTLWYYDHEFGIVHQGGVCPTCRAMLDHQLRHRCDASYQDAIMAREQRLSYAVDAAVQRAVEAAVQQATAHLEATNESLRRELDRVEDDRDRLADEVARMRSIVDMGGDRDRRRSSRSRSPPRRYRSPSRDGARTSRRDRSPPSYGGSRHGQSAPVAGPSGSSGSSRPKGKQRETAPQAAADVLPQDAMAVDDAPAPPPARVVGTWSYSDLDDDDDDDEDDRPRRKKKGKAPQPQLPPPHEPAQAPRERHSSGLTDELVTMYDGTNPYIVSRKGNYVRVGEHVLDARCPLPPRDPTTSDINPLTGQRWRPAELRMYPNGYYGLPANGREGVVDARQSVVAVADAADPRTPLFGGEEDAPLPAALRRDLPPHYNDMSRVDLKDFWDSSKARYRMPRNPQEYGAFAQARERPGNWMALQLWNRWIAQADAVSGRARSTAQHVLLKHRKKKPSWAIPPPNPRPAAGDQQPTRRTLAERLDMGAGSNTQQDNVLPPAGNQNTTTPGQEEDEPMDGDGDTTPGVGTEQAPQDDALLPDASMHHADGPEAGEILDEPYAEADVRVAGNTNGQSRGQVANVDAGQLQRVREWIESNHADVPGIDFDEAGAITNEQVLRGFYRVAQTGPPSGLMTDVIEYVHVVADAMRESQIVLLPRTNPLNWHFDNYPMDVTNVVTHLNEMAGAASRELLEYDSPWDHSGTAAAVDAWGMRVVRPETDADLMDSQ